MVIVTLEGIVEGGNIRLPENIRIPDRTKVYVVVPDFQVEQVARLASPRLARSADLADFKLEVFEADPDAGL